MPARSSTPVDSSIGDPAGVTARVAEQVRDDLADAVLVAEDDRAAGFGTAASGRAADAASSADALPWRGAGGGGSGLRPQCCGAIPWHPPSTSRAAGVCG
jgi:hypothetical protein